MSASYFTKARLAGMLGVKVQSIDYLFQNIPASACVDVKDTRGTIRARGVEAWSYDALPAELLARCEVEGRQLGFVSGRAFLESGERPWQPRIPWNNLARECQRKAEQGRRALTPSIERKDLTHLSAAEFEARGLADYEREFGERISARHFRTLLKRTLQRDGGREDFARMEIYLPDRLYAAEAKAPVRVEVAPQGTFPLVERAVQGVADKSNPTLMEVDALYASAVETFDAARHSHPRPGRLKRDLLESIRAAVPIAPTLNAARVAFDCRYKAWLGAEGEQEQARAVADHRRKEFKQPKAITPAKQKQRDLLAAHAGINHGGRLAPAKRELQEMRLYPSDESDAKSYVNAADRKAARRTAEIIDAGTRGSRGFRDLTPKLQRDPERLFANDIFTGDDFTMPILVWWEADTEQGFGWGNGQTLIISDFRCWFVLSFSIQPEAQYNSHVVKTALTRAGMEHGLPKRIYFERGQIWEHSRILKGDDTRANDWQAAHSDAEFVFGLKSQLGITFMHAQSPQAKSQIERLGGMLQDLMFSERGYTGRDQRQDLPERTRREIAQVKAGVHPSKFWYHIDDWRKRFKEIVERYNHTKQQGEWLKNISPHDAFINYQNPADPPIKLDAQSWIYLAAQKRRWRVRADGVITFKVLGEQYRYFNEETTVRLGGEMVVTWWNPETPEFIGVTDLSGRNPILVPRALKTHPCDPSDPATRDGLGMKARSVAALKAKYETLPVKAVRNFRPTFVTRDVAALAQQMTEKRETLSKEKRQSAGREREAARLCERLGLPIATYARDMTDEKLESLRNMARNTDEEPASTSASTKKTYVLDTPPVVNIAQVRAVYWNLRRQVEERGINVHAITHKVLGMNGENAKVAGLSVEQLERMTGAFAAILRKET